MTKKEKIPEVLLASEVLTRGVEDIITREEAERMFASGKKLRIKLGIDATSPDLHIGHAVPLWKIRALQDAGHKAVIILGEFTTRIGDPTGRDASRPVLTPAVIRRNIAALKKQLGMILRTDSAHFEFHSNKEWHSKMREGDFLNLCAMVTHARLIERDMFQGRMKSGKEITITELLYPILQGYDSVVIKSDMTIIGSDQLFNEHFGRFFQEKLGQKPQAIITLKILPGLDGGAKMSKSLGNYIALNDIPQDKFGKAMRLIDSLIVPYLEVYTDVAIDDIRRVEQEIVAGSNPRDAKLFFAEALVRRYHGAVAGGKERERFLATFSERRIPDEMPEIAVEEKEWHSVDLLVHLNLALSKAEARRLIIQKAVDIDGKVIENFTLAIAVKKGMVVRVGKRRFVRVV
ncbi:MAG: tyrosine--tRNA ligase [Candidatus Sungiibacteriota bacterium]